jgi:hypothetical protein
MKKTTESEALEFLDRIETELAEAANQAVAELQDVQRSVASHEAAMAHYRATGGAGLLPYLSAKSFFRELSEEIFGATRPLGRSGTAEFGQFFSNRSEHLTRQAKAKYIRKHAREIASACQTIITARTVNRAAWRDRIGDQIASIVKRQSLTSLSREEGAQVEGQLISLENALADRDTEFQEASRLSARLAANYGSDDIIDVYNGATSFARGMKHYETVVALAEAA